MIRRTSRRHNGWACSIPRAVVVHGGSPVTKRAHEVDEQQLLAGSHVPHQRLTAARSRRSPSVLNARTWWGSFPQAMTVLLL